MKFDGVSVEFYYFKEVLNMTVKQLFKIWITYKKEHVKPRTFERYNDIINRYINVNIGASDISDIDHKCLQRMLEKLYKKGSNEPLAASSINTVISVLNLGFEYACDLGLIDNNPCVRIKRLNTTSNKSQAFSRSDQIKLERYITSARNDSYFGILLCLYSGLRIGELLGLKWEDFDVENGAIYVKRTVYRRNMLEMDDDDLNSPKTQSSERVIPLPYHIKNMLIDKMIKSKGEYIVSNAHGRPMLTRTYQKIFKNVCFECGVKPLNFHSLRHTFATRAIESGMDVKTLSELMGHKSATITLNRYAHSMLETKIAMMNRLALKMIQE